MPLSLSMQGALFVVSLPAASFAASPDCPAATLAAAHGCQVPGATVSPNATWAACFSLTDQRASSIGQCVEWCRKKGMTPACIGSAEENDFAASLVPDYDGAWIGHYQIGNDPEPAEGWGRCVAGEASGFANWDEVLGQPNGEHWGLHSDCAGIAGNGGWYDGPCVVPAMIGLTFRCLCKGPSSASDSFAQDLVVLEAAVQADVDNQQARMVPVYGICSVIALLPAVLLCFGLCFGELRRRASHSSAKVYAAEEHLNPGREESLHAMKRSAAKRRLRVSGLMLQIGWLMFLFGMAPLLLKRSIGGPMDAVIGFWYFYTVLWHPGTYLMLLAMLPTDARSIKIIAAVHVIVSIGYTVRIILKQTQQLGLEDIAEVGKITLIFVTTAGCVPIFTPRAARFERLLLRRLGLCVRGVLAVAEHQEAEDQKAQRLRAEEAYAIPARLGLRRLWLLQRFFSFGMGVLLFSSTVGMLLLRPNLIRHPLVASQLAAAAVFIACSVVCRPTNRGRFRGFLGRLGRRGHTEEEKAAAISALMGGANPTKVLADAEELFRCLRASRLVAEDLAGSGLKGDAAEPNKAEVDAAVLAAKTEPAQLGEVTCFLSHSWRDEDEVPGAKYKEFSRWAKTHEETTGKEPTLWLVSLPQHPTCKHAPALRAAWPLAAG